MLLLGAAVCGLTTFLLLEFAIIPNDLDGSETVAALVAVLIPCVLPVICFERRRGFRAVTAVSVLYGIVLAAWGLGAVMIPVAVLQTAALRSPGAAASGLTADLRRGRPGRRSRS
jgi:hypothetical protein